MNFRAKLESEMAEKTSAEEAAIAKYIADVDRLTNTIASLEE
jgi:hypothetical protein